MLTSPYEIELVFPINFYVKKYMCRIVGAV